MSKAPLTLPYITMLYFQKQNNLFAMTTIQLQSENRKINKKKLQHISLHQLLWNTYTIRVKIM